MSHVSKYITKCIPNVFPKELFEVWGKVNEAWIDRDRNRRVKREKCFFFLQGYYKGKYGQWLLILQFSTWGKVNITFFLYLFGCLTKQKNKFLKFAILVRSKLNWWQTDSFQRLQYRFVFDLLGTFWKIQHFCNNNVQKNG